MRGLTTDEKKIIIKTPQTVRVIVGKFCNVLADKMGSHISLELVIQYIFGSDQTTNTVSGGDF